MSNSINNSNSNPEIRTKHQINLKKFNLKGLNPRISKYE